MSGCGTSQGSRTPSLSAPSPPQTPSRRPVGAPAKSPPQVPAQRSEGGAGLREGWALSVGMWIRAGQTSESSSPPSRERLAGQRQLWPARAGRGRGRRSRGGVARGCWEAVGTRTGRAGDGQGSGARKRVPDHPAWHSRPECAAAQESASADPQQPRMPLSKLIGVWFAADQSWRVRAGPSDHSAELEAVATTAAGGETPKRAASAHCAAARGERDGVRRSFQHPRSKMCRQVGMAAHSAGSRASYVKVGLVLTWS